MSSTSSLSTVCGEDEISGRNESKTSIIKSICNLLLEMINENKDIKCNFLFNTIDKTLFNSKSLRKIELSEYLNRIIKYIDIEDSTYILSLIYLDRFCEKNKFSLTNTNVHKYFT